MLYLWFMIIITISLLTYLIYKYYYYYYYHSADRKRRPNCARPATRTWSSASRVTRWRKTWRCSRRQVPMSSSASPWSLACWTRCWATARSSVLCLRWWLMVVMEGRSWSRFCWCSKWKGDIEELSQVMRINNVILKWILVVLYCTLSIIIIIVQLFSIRVEFINWFVGIYEYILCVYIFLCWFHSCYMSSYHLELVVFRSL